MIVRSTVVTLNWSAAKELFIKLPYYLLHTHIVGAVDGCELQVPFLRVPIRIVVFGGLYGGLLFLAWDTL